MVQDIKVQEIKVPSRSCSSAAGLARHGRSAFTKRRDPPRKPRSRTASGLTKRGRSRGAPHDARGTAPGAAQPMQCRPKPARNSLQLDLRTRLLELSLELVGLFLGHAFLHGLRSGLDEVLGLLEA